MKRSYQRRPEDFKRRLIKKVYDRKELLNEEQRWLNMMKPEELKNRYYNMRTKVSDPWYGDPNKAKTVKEKIALRNREKWKDPEYRAKMEKALPETWKKANSEEVREKQRLAMIDTMAKKFPIENRRRRQTETEEELSTLLSQRSKDMWAKRTPEERAIINEKNSKAQKGKPRQLHSEETKLKMSKSHKGKAFSEEHIANMRKIWDDATPEQRAEHGRRVSEGLRRAREAREASQNT